MTRPKEGFYLFVAFIITCCFISGPDELWHHAYRIGGTYLLLGGVLTVLFFRRKMFLLLIYALTISLVLAGVTVMFHPSVAGFVFTIGPAIALYLLVVWDVKKHPEQQSGDWLKTFFDR
jgi:hypothetical protein